MDSLALLRRLNPDVPEVTSEVLATAFDDLESEMVQSEQSSRARQVSRRRRRVAARLLVPAGAVAAAGALVTVLVVGGPASAPANAAEVLQRAANHAGSTSLAGAGTTVEFTQRVLDQRETESSRGIDVAIADSGVTLLRIPDGDQAWLRKRWNTASTLAYGSASAADLDNRDVPTKAHPSFESSKIGAFVNNPSPKASAYLGEYPETIQDLPRDPVELLKALRAAGDGPGAGTGWQVLATAATVLTSGVADSSLQQAVFTALQQMPDLTIIDHHATDLLGRDAVVIGLKPDVSYLDKVGTSTQLLIDPSTGGFLGIRQIKLHRDGVVPAGTTVYEEAMRTDVRVSPDEWTVPKGDVLFRYP